MIWLLYYFLMFLMVIGIRFSALWNSKSAIWLKGHKQQAQLLKLIPDKENFRIWFHVASLGEFEQARPVIEKLKLRDPKMEIILSFFSSSGYTIRSGFPLASVYYLPFDLPGNAAKWIEQIKPDVAVFVKYDLWPGYLRAVQQKEIPAMLISAHWSPRGWFHSWSLPPVKSLLKNFNVIFFQQADYLEVFKEKGFKNIRVAGDTRIDRSLELPQEANQRIPSVLKNASQFDLIAGSTWPLDEKIIMEAVTTLDLKIMLAPHDIAESNIQRLLKTIPVPLVRLSNMTGKEKDIRVVIVDNIGLLAFLYGLGKIAYVGGGFGAGIHNTLEPMAHARPILFGPSYQAFPEAVEMVKQEAARSVGNSTELIQAIKEFQQPGIAEQAGKKNYDYLVQHSGASEIVTNSILDSIPSRLEK